MIRPAQFRVRAIVVDAMQWPQPGDDDHAGTVEALCRWVTSRGAAVRDPESNGDAAQLITSRGVFALKPGTWVVRGRRGGDFHVCEPHVFDTVYRRREQTASGVPAGRC